MKACDAQAATSGTMIVHDVLYGPLLYQALRRPLPKPPANAMPSEPCDDLVAARIRRSFCSLLQRPLVESLRNKIIINHHVLHLRRLLLGCFAVHHSLILPLSSFPLQVTCPKRLGGHF